MRGRDELLDGSLETTLLGRFRRTAEDRLWVDSGISRITDIEIDGGRATCRRCARGFKYDPPDEMAIRNFAPPARRSDAFHIVSTVLQPTRKAHRDNNSFSPSLLTARTAHCGQSGST
jgi:hypothetical protein